MKYQAVNTSNLRHLLGTQCSPVGRCRYTGTEPGYVIGPNIEGDAAHLATCRSMEEARRLAAQWNEEYTP